jgi:hypothetical protein
MNCIAVINDYAGTIPEENIELLSSHLADVYKL